MAVPQTSVRSIPLPPNLNVGLRGGAAERQTEQSEQIENPALRDLYEAAMADPERRKELEKMLGPNPLQALKGMDGDMAELILQWLQSKQNDRNAARDLGNMSGGRQNMGNPVQALGGGNSPGGGGTPGGSGASNPSSGPGRSGSPQQAGPSRSNDVGPPAHVDTANFTGDDKQKAAFIDNYLKSKGSPAANPNGGATAGEMMVDAGKKNNVDPLVLLSIAGQETVFGTRGVGMQKMLGVSAYDHNPRNVNPTFDGLKNQIYKGAETFARLRGKGGASASDDLGTQLRAANRAGWATDPNWHSGVARHYRSVASAIPSSMTG